MTILDDLYKVWNDHDIDVVLSYFDDELVYTDKCIGATFNGRDELAAFMASTFVSIPDLTFELVSTVETTDACAGEALMRGTFKEDLGPIQATGKEFVVQYAVVGTLAERTSSPPCASTCRRPRPPPTAWARPGRPRPGRSAWPPGSQRPDPQTRPVDARGRLATAME